MPLADDLAQHLQRFATAPFLFVGSGLSRRYLDLPAWEGLLRHFADATGKPYARYLSDADGSLPQVATLIADDFRDIWWSDPRYQASRDSNPGVATREGPLKIEVAALVADSLRALPQDGPLHDEVVLLGQAVVEGVVTTNYDPLMEHVFPGFRAFAGQDDILFKAPLGVGEIYKIHGSHTAPESMVLTAGDYARLRARNAYLAAKLLTMFVEHPVVFLGYSLGDPDVVEILGSIAAALTSQNIGELQDRLVFVQWDPAAADPVLTRTAIVADGITIPVVSVTVAGFADVYKALASLKRRFPARLLRQLKEQVYDLVLTSESKGTVYVQDLDAAADTDDVDMVIGVGIKDRLDTVGVVGLTRADLLHDVLKDTSALGSPADIVDKALPLLLKNRANTPVYAYLRAAGRLTDDGALADPAANPAPVAARVAAGTRPLLPPNDYRRRGREVIAEAGDLNGLIARGDTDDVLFYAPMLPADKIDTDALRGFLTDNSDLLTTGHALQATQWKKCVCLYDLLRNQRTS